VRLAKQSARLGHTPNPDDYSRRPLYGGLRAPIPEAVLAVGTPSVRPHPDRRAAWAPSPTPSGRSRRPGMTISGYSQPYAVPSTGGGPRPARRERRCRTRRLNRPGPRHRPGELDRSRRSRRPGLRARMGRMYALVEVRNTVQVTSEGDTYLVDGTPLRRTIIGVHARAARARPTRRGQHPRAHTPGLLAAPTLVSAPIGEGAARRAADDRRQRARRTPRSAALQRRPQGCAAARSRLKGDRITLQGVALRGPRRRNGSARFHSPRAP